MVTSSDRLLDLAAALADVADQVTMPYFRHHGLGMWNKADGSRVTEADVACETAILKRLVESAPGDEVLTEESGGSARIGERWIIDPIDGTENFSRGNPVWGTLIAREIDGVPAIAMISAPALGQRWWAVRGGGAFLSSGQRLSVSTITDPALATFCYGGFHECPTQRERDAVVTAAETFRCAWGWGNFWGHVQVAQGAAEVALSFGTQLWDVAAPALVVAEAGGDYGDVLGDSSLTNGSLLTSNGNFPDVLRSKLAE